MLRVSVSAGWRKICGRCINIYAYSQKTTSMREKKDSKKKKKKKGETLVYILLCVLFFKSVGGQFCSIVCLFCPYVVSHVAIVGFPKSIRCDWQMFARKLDKFRGIMSVGDYVDFLHRPFGKHRKYTHNANHSLLKDVGSLETLFIELGLTSSCWS